MTPGTAPASRRHTRQPDGAVVLDASSLDPQEDEVEWRTGTVMDLYNGLYRILCVNTPRRAAMSPADVDALDLSTCAVLIGVGADPGAADRAELAEIGRRIRTGEQDATDAAWEVEDWPDMNAMRRPA